jgi:hypothetical protein
MVVDVNFTNETKVCPEEVDECRIVGIKTFKMVRLPRKIARLIIVPLRSYFSLIFY